MKIMRKICCVLVEPKGFERQGALRNKRKLFEILKKDQLLGPDVEVDVKPLENGVKEFRLYTLYSYFEFLTAPYILEAMIQAEKEGYSAVTVACIFDPAIEEAQNILKIPVVGIGEASMLVARMLGRPRGTAIITMSDRAIPKIHSLIDKYKFRSFMISNNAVRKISHDIYIKASTSPLPEEIQALKDAYVNVAEGCVNDGADVIITGCGGMGPLLEVEGVHEIDGVPIINPITAALMVCRAMMDLRKAGITSNKRLSWAPTTEDWIKGRNSFGLEQMRKEMITR
jgi:Asp/Glu/hydantoin racemase